MKNISARARTPAIVFIRFNRSGKAVNVRLPTLAKVGVGRSNRLARSIIFPDV